MAHSARRPTEVALMGFVSGTADLVTGSEVLVTPALRVAPTSVDAVGSESEELSG
jgi:hypothetical protein